MRTSLLAGLTTRGTSFLAAGAAAALAGYLIGERALFCVGIALVALPLLAAMAAKRGQLHISTSRVIRPPRAPAGHTAIVTLRLVNSARVSTGLLLAEDTVPYALGTRPRYVLDKIERYGFRELTYPLRSDVRGKFEIGPLQLRVADSFGLVEVTKSISGRTTFFVTPRVVPLSRTVISRSWAGEGDGRARLTSTAGEDDVVPREYRDGDELRRVHWRSTARYGELMVRREEQRFRNRATVFLDSRGSAHMGTGAASSFELAISAAASVGAHIAQQGLTGHFVTDGGVVSTGPFFEDRLLDTLAVIRPSSRRVLHSAFEQIRMSSAGVIIAIMGQLSVADAQHLAACRSEGSQGIALLLDVRTWSDNERAGQGANSRNGADLDAISSETGPARAGATGASDGPGLAGLSENGAGNNGSGKNSAGKNGASTNGAGRIAAGSNGGTDGVAASSAATNGAATNGAATSGAATSGVAASRAATNGAATSRAANDGAATNGAATNGAVTDRGANDSAEVNGAVSSGSADSPASNGSDTNGIGVAGNVAADSGTGGSRTGGNGGQKSPRRRSATETEAAAAVLRSAGWQVTIVDANTPLAAAWRRLPRTSEIIPAGARRPTAPQGVPTPGSTTPGDTAIGTTDANGGQPA
jgi:uncharacterized protein (DUF58 family)